MVATNPENGDPRSMSDSEKPNGFGARHFQAVLLFGALLFGYFLRVNMSVAVVAMIEVYGWDPFTKQVILSSFFWGYVVAQLPAGLLSQRFGAKIVLIISTIICSLINIILPFLASFGYEYICGARVVIGLTQGVVYPCVHSLLAKWTPKTERAFLATIVYSGAQLGTAIVLATSGIIADTPALGWKSIFFITGGVTLVWCVTYLIFGANSPAEVRNISKIEKEYVESLTGSSENKNFPTPWKALFTSVPFYALIFAHCGFTWGFYTLLTNIPSYMASALDMEISQNGLLSALPYVAMWLLAIFISPIADLLSNRGITTVETSRKIFNTIGQWGPMVCLISLGYVTRENIPLAVTLLTLGVGLNAGSFVGYMVNHMDLAPNFAGTMMGITNGLSNLLSIFAPLVVGAVVKDDKNSAEWRIVFFITGGVYLVCNLIFILFGKASTQPWNEVQSSPNEKKNIQENNNSKCTSF